MIQNLLSMNGYGLFVWSSFLITFLACAFVYYKAHKTLKNMRESLQKKLTNFQLSRKK